MPLVRYQQWKSGVWTLAQVEALVHGLVKSGWQVEGIHEDERTRQVWLADEETSPGGIELRVYKEMIEFILAVIGAVVLAVILAVVIFGGIATVWCRVRYGDWWWKGESQE